MILNPALRHPVVSVTAAGGLLVFLAIPAFSLHTATPGFETLPQNIGVIKTYKRIQAAFPGGPIPAQVVVQSQDVRSLPVIAGVNDLTTRAAASPNFKRPITTTVSPDHTVEEVDIPVTGAGTDSRSDGGARTAPRHADPSHDRTGALTPRSTSPATPRARRTSTTR